MYNKTNIQRNKINNTERNNLNNNKLKKKQTNTVLKKKTQVFNPPLFVPPVIDITSQYSIHGLLAHIASKHNKNRIKNDDGRNM